MDGAGAKPERMILTGSAVLKSRIAADAAPISHRAEEHGRIDDTLAEQALTRQISTAGRLMDAFKIHDPIVRQRTLAEIAIGLMQDMAHFKQKTGGTRTALLELRRNKSQAREIIAMIYSPEARGLLVSRLDELGISDDKDG